MGKFVEYPKWKYAKPASEIDRPRSIIVANADQEAALDGEWFDTPDYRNLTREETEDVVSSAIPDGYVPQEYPKWLYTPSVAGGRIVYNQGEEDALHDAHPDVEWSTSPDTVASTQLKSFGLMENTGINVNDPMKASDPVKLESNPDDDAAAAAIERSRTTDDDAVDQNTIEASDPVDDTQVDTTANTVKANAEKVKETAKKKAPKKDANKAKPDDDLL